MKLAVEKNTFQSNVDNSTSMNFGIGDMAMVIDILRNRLYEKKVQTTVQEYLSNARDANREAKATKPIQITVPTRSDPTFKVRDHGPGVDPSRMAEVFVMYGVSTKRNTNEQTGGLGIGCKSAFSYTDSFTIITYVNGVMRTYVAHIGANKTGRVDLVAEVETSEPNGTEIQIVSKPNDIDEFKKAIIRATMFWKEEEFPTFTNLAFDPTIRAIGLDRFEGTNISGKDAYNQTGSSINIVIDGIPYPMLSSHLQEFTDFKSLTGSSKFSIHIPNGLVQVAANREKIDDSDISKDALKQVFIAAIAEFRKVKQKWEDSIVDLDSLIAAQKKQSDFILSSEKEFENVKLLNGKLNYVGNVEFRKVDRDGTQIKSFYVNESGYYLIRKGERSIKDIRSWMMKQGIHNIRLITIMAQEYVDETLADGKTISVPKRNDAKALEIESTFKKLGFKNIADYVPKPEKKPREKKEKSERVYFNIYRLDKYGDEDRLEIDTLDNEKKTGPWIYFVGKKYTLGQYEKFNNIAVNLMAFGDVQYAFRVTEHKAKLIKNDSRFVEWEEFMKTWKPGSGTTVALIHTNSYNTKYNWTLFDNLSSITHIDHPVIKAAKKIQSQASVSLHYDLRKYVKENGEYNDIVLTIKEINSLANKYIPYAFLSGNKEQKAHLPNYVEWGLTQAVKDGVKISIPKVLL